MMHQTDNTGVCRERDPRVYQKPGVRSVSVEEWAEWVRQGIDLPVQIQVHGSSMHPLIRKERDPVTILPLKELPRRGEIVLFYSTSKKRYVLHRVIRVSETEIITRGDNCDSADPPFPPEQLRGRAVRLKRGRCSYRLTGKLPCLLGMGLAACRHGSRKFRAAFMFSQRGHAVN